MTDPYRTAGIRERVLAAWTAMPARFREDANAEEDQALGGYRDRVLVELAQNAADAAARAGVPGRLRLSLAGGVLEAANTGAPLDAAGVIALSTLRASAKRDEAGAVGRFGVGFAAVVAVSDTPSIVSAQGGVQWSVPRTRELVASIPELAAEVAVRAGAVPALRLPFELAGAVPPPDGFDTVVRLPLRDAEAEKSVREQLDRLGPALLLALPGLRTIEVVESGRRLTAAWGDGEVVIDGVGWRTVEATGTVAAQLLADRPTEERHRAHWQVRWALPDRPVDVPKVVHAPTPSDEPLGLPALLIASFPLAPDRRHVASGPLTSLLVARAADAYLELLRSLPLTPALLDLVPGPLAAAELDGAIRRAILDRLPSLPLHGSVVVDAPPAFVELLAQVLPNLLPPGWPARHVALEPLGIRRMELADVVDALAGLDRDPAWWRALYEALGDTGTDGLGALPVPLADGRTVRGVRGLLVAGPGIDPADLAPLGLRFVHPDAVSGLLLRLGAVRADARTVLTDPGVRGAVAGSLDLEDDAEADELAHAVLALVAAARPEPGELPWLAELSLPATDGDRYPAGELLLPDSPLAGLMVADAPFGTVAGELVEEFGTEALEAAGVLATFALIRAEDVSLADVEAGSYHLDGEEEWAEDTHDRLPDTGLPPTIIEFTAIRDLELVADWAAALELLARPPLRAALTDPTLALTAEGRRVAVPSYSTWWLSGHPILAGRRPDELRMPGGDPLLAELYEPAPATLDPVLAAALGVRTSLEDLLAAPGGPDELLARMVAREVSRETLRALWSALAAIADEDEVTAPEQVRAVVDGVVELVPAVDALVLDRPDAFPLLSAQPLVLLPYDLARRLADLLDLPTASEEITGLVEGAGSERELPGLILSLLPAAPEVYRHHDTLAVDGVAVDWWQDGATMHATAAGMARGAAWAAGRWGDRLLVEAALREPDQLPALLADADLAPDY